MHEHCSCAVVCGVRPCRETEVLRNFRSKGSANVPPSTGMCWFPSDVVDMSHTQRVREE